MNSVKGQYNRIKSKFISSEGNSLRLLLLIVMILVVMGILKGTTYLSLNNLSSMAFQIPEFGILCAAMAISMIIGGIDLSIVAQANLAAIVAAFFMTSQISPDMSNASILLIVVLAVLVAVVVGAVSGIINGLLISKVGIPPILATLGTMQLFTGIAVVTTEGAAIGGYPDMFLAIGNSDIFGVPLPLIVFIIVIGIISLILSKSSFGLKMYMFGSNHKASKFSGLNNDKIVILTHMIVGILAAIAGIIIMSRTNSARANYGTSYILQTILVCVMGGVNPDGGVGKLTGIVMSVITLQLISSGFNMLRISSYSKDLVWGSLLILIMIINYYIDKRKN